MPFPGAGEGQRGREREGGREGKNPRARKYNEAAGLLSLGSLPDRELCRFLATRTTARGLGRGRDCVGAGITAQIRVIPRLSDWKVILKLATFYSGRSHDSRTALPARDDKDPIFLSLSLSLCTFRSTKGSLIPLR